LASLPGVNAHNFWIRIARLLWSASWPMNFVPLEDVDEAVLEVADQQVARDGAEARRGDREALWTLEGAIAGDTAHGHAEVGEHVNEPTAPRAERAKPT
jgi:hypothetical protein